MSRIRFLTAGESHGEFLTGIIEGIPAGLDLSQDDFIHDETRRRSGIGRSSRMKLEESSVEITAGVRNGKTTGAPIAIRIKNHVRSDMKEGEGSLPLTIPRPGHADYTGYKKFKLDDIRDVIERASARETAARVALGSIAKKFLGCFGIEFTSRPLQIGDIYLNYSSLYPTNRDINGNLESIRNETDKIYKSTSSRLYNMRERIKECADTTGGSFQAIGYNVPIGLGSYTQADLRLDARLAKVVLSIPSVKGCSFGAIQDPQLQYSRLFRDAFDTDGTKIWRKSNYAGGIEGGISNGEPVLITGFVKPVPTLNEPDDSVDLSSLKHAPPFSVNSDMWVVEAAGVIAESVIAIEILDCFLDKFGGDSLLEIKERYPQK